MYDVKNQFLGMQRATCRSLCGILINAKALLKVVLYKRLADFFSKPSSPETVYSIDCSKYFKVVKKMSPADSKRVALLTVLALVCRVFQNCVIRFEQVRTALSEKHNAGI